jgi:hypothetical protein
MGVDKIVNARVSIDMRDADNFAQARRLAEASTAATACGEMPRAWLADLAPNAERLWCVYTVVDGDTLVCAITGDGSESNANAAFYVDARRIVFGLIQEVERLTAELARDRARIAALEAALVEACDGWLDMLKIQVSWSSLKTQARVRIDRLRAVAKGRF